MSESALAEKPAWVVKGIISGEVLDGQNQEKFQGRTLRETTELQEVSKERGVTDSEIKSLIQAQNRTTHAVRAFVLFLFYQLSALTTAFLIYSFAQWQGNQSEECELIIRQYGACEPQPFLLMLALFVWIAGVIYSSRIGWREIKKSEI